MSLLKMSKLLFEDDRLGKNKPLNKTQLEGGPSITYAELKTKLAPRIAQELIKKSKNISDLIKAKEAEANNVVLDGKVLEKLKKIEDSPLGVLTYPDRTLLNQLFIGNFSLGLTDKLEGRIHFNPIQTKIGSDQIEGGRANDLAVFKQANMYFSFLSTESSQLVLCNGKLIVIGIPALGKNCIDNLDILLELYDGISKENPVPYKFETVGFFLLPIDKIDEFQTNMLPTIKSVIAAEKRVEETLIYKKGLKYIFEGEGQLEAGKPVDVDANAKDDEGTDDVPQSRSSTNLDHVKRASNIIMNFRQDYKNKFDSSREVKIFLNDLKNMSLKIKGSQEDIENNSEFLTAVLDFYEKAMSLVNDLLDDRNIEISKESYDLYYNIYDMYYKFLKYTKFDKKILDTENYSSLKSVFENPMPRLPREDDSDAEANEEDTGSSGTAKDEAPPSTRSSQDDEGNDDVSQSQNSVDIDAVKNAANKILKMTKDYEGYFDSDNATHNTEVVFKGTKSIFGKIRKSWGNTIPNNEENLTTVLGFYEKAMSLINTVLDDHDIEVSEENYRLYTDVYEMCRNFLTFGSFNKKLKDSILDSKNYSSLKSIENNRLPKQPREDDSDDEENEEDTGSSDTAEDEAPPLTRSSQDDVQAQDDEDEAPPLTRSSLDDEEDEGLTQEVSQKSVVNFVNFIMGLNDEEASQKLSEIFDEGIESYLNSLFKNVISYSRNFKKALAQSSFLRNSLKQIFNKYNLLYVDQRSLPDSIYSPGYEEIVEFLKNSKFDVSDSDNLPLIWLEYLTKDADYAAINDIIKLVVKKVLVDVVKQNLKKLSKDSSNKEILKKYLQKFGKEELLKFYCMCFFSDVEEVESVISENKLKDLKDKLDDSLKTVFEPVANKLKPVTNKIDDFKDKRNKEIIDYLEKVIKQLIENNEITSLPLGWRKTFDEGIYEGLDWKTKNEYNQIRKNNSLIATVNGFYSEMVELKWKELVEKDSSIKDKYSSLSNSLESYSKIAAVGIPAASLLFTGGLGTLPLVVGAGLFFGSTEVGQSINWALNIHKNRGRHIKELPSSVPKKRGNRVAKFFLDTDLIGYSQKFIKNKLLSSSTDKLQNKLSFIDKDIKIAKEIEKVEIATQALMQRKNYIKSDDIIEELERQDFMYFELDKDQEFDDIFQKFIHNIEVYIDKEGVAYYDEDGNKISDGASDRENYIAKTIYDSSILTYTLDNYLKLMKKDKPNMTDTDQKKSYDIAKLIRDMSFSDPESTRLLIEKMHDDPREFENLIKKLSGNKRKDLKELGNFIGGNSRRNITQEIILDETQYDNLEKFLTGLLKSKIINNKYLKSESVKNILKLSNIKKDDSGTMAARDQIQNIIVSQKIISSIFKSGSFKSKTDMFGYYVSFITQRIIFNIISSNNLTNSALFKNLIFVMNERDIDSPIKIDNLFFAKELFGGKAAIKNMFGDIKTKDRNLSFILSNFINKKDLKNLSEFQKSVSRILAESLHKKSLSDLLFEKNNFNKVKSKKSKLEKEWLRIWDI